MHRPGLASEWASVSASASASVSGSLPVASDLDAESASGKATFSPVLEWASDARLALSRTVPPTECPA
jgi:hypothetical protein